ncbi:MAG: hypothetical protein KIS77_01810 [Saprospiraceae bacterium]|nr:hypothetical protein [Saprospiraceae bacterium]
MKPFENHTLSATPLSVVVATSGGYLRAFVLLLCVGLVSPAIGQPERFYLHHLTAKEGLSQSINPFVHKDQQGFVWISSSDGLNRFDGQSVRVYRPEQGRRHSMVGNNIQSPFFEDEQGNIWFGTVQAINCYRRATDDFFTFQISLDGTPWSSSYYIFHRDGKGRLWTRLNDSLYRITPPQQLGSPPMSENIGRLDGFYNFALSDEATGEVFGIVSTNSTRDAGFVLYEIAEGKLRKKNHFLKGEKGKKGYSIRRLLPENKRLVWLTSSEGLLLFDIEKGVLVESFNTFEGERVGQVVDVERLGADYLFVSTQWAGLLLFDRGKAQFVRRYRHDPDDPASLSSDELNEIYVDRDQVVWISIWAVGVDYGLLDKNKFHLVRSKSLYFSNESRFSADAIAQDDNGVLWLGSNMAPLRSVAANTVAPRKETPNGKNQFTSVIRMLRNGDLLFAPSIPDQNAYLYDLRRRTFQAIQNGRGFNDFFQLRDGTILAASDAGVCQIVRKAGSVAAEKPMGFEQSYISQIHQDKNGLIYLSVDGQTLAISSIKDGRLKTEAEVDIGGYVYAFAETDTFIWMGGDFGLRRLPLWDAQKPSSQPDTILSSTVYGILPDEQQHFWLSTNYGLLRLHPVTWKSRRYNLADGLQGYEFNSRAYQKTPDGRLWFGGVDGLNYFLPSELRDVSTQPKVCITEVKINDEVVKKLPRNVTMLDSLFCDYFQNTLAFDFVAMEYSDPVNNRLRYRLSYADGRHYDGTWISCESARGFARYANLPSGAYLLEITAANSDGIENPTPRRLFIKIEPPFWEKWWFYLVCFLAATSIVVSYFRAYVRRQLREKNLQLREQRLQIEKQEALTQERNRIAGEMHDDLGGGLTSIRMLSSRVQKKTTDPSLQEQVNKIADYSQDLVQKMGEIIWAMNSNFDTVENLVAYIRRYAVDFLDVSGLHYHIREPEEITDEAISGERRRNLYLAVKESLHNVVKHAQAERVSISFELKNDCLVVQVQDDGKGIELEKINQFGNGLHNMRQRLQDVGGEMRIENMDGTLLTFIIPIEKTTQP